MRLLIAFTLLLLTLPVSSIDPAFLASLDTAASGVSYTFSEGFEGTGYENASWVETGSPNEDSTDNVFEGSQSLNTPTPSRSDTPAFDNLNSGWFYCSLVVAANGTAERNVLLFYDGSTTLQFGVLIETSGELNLRTASIINENTYFTSTATRYHVWFHWVAGSGSDGLVEIYVNTTDTLPALTDSISTGEFTGPINTVRFGSGVSGAPNLYFDKVRVSASAIGSSPE